MPFEQPVFNAIALTLTNFLLRIYHLTSHIQLTIVVIGTAAHFGVCVAGLGSGILGLDPGAGAGAYCGACPGMGLEGGDVQPWIAKLFIMVLSTAVWVSVFGIMGWDVFGINAQGEDGGASNSNKNNNTNYLHPSDTRPQRLLERSSLYRYRSIDWKAKEYIFDNVDVDVDHISFDELDIDDLEFDDDGTAYLIQGREPMTLDDIAEEMEMKKRKINMMKTTARATETAPSTATPTTTTTEDDSTRFEAWKSWTKYISMFLWWVAIMEVFGVASNGNL